MATPRDALFLVQRKRSRFPPGFMNVYSPMEVRDTVGTCKFGNSGTRVLITVDDLRLRLRVFYIKHRKLINSKCWKSQEIVPEHRPYSSVLSFHPVRVTKCPCEVEGWLAC